MEPVVEHYGVKGMHWGIRREDGSPRFTKQQVKKAAVIFGAAVGVAAITVGSVYAAKHMKGSMGDIKVSDISIPPAAKKFAEAMAKEPVGVVHGARTKNKGFTFPGRGGLSDPSAEWMKAGFTGSGLPAGVDPATKTHAWRYGDRGEKIAAVFPDPLGRRDRAGREIHHEVMLPEEVAKKVKDLSDVPKVAWDLIKDTYDALYEADVNIPQERR